MAKQTFTTGQVLTAAQMNSLQSNDFNQTVSVKTASYTLVAADKGTRIEFNTSGSVTCTVNTGLFDAGDTVIIQNRGTGDVTVTAGTATVNTAGSLVISQYQNAILYFISTGASILFAGNAGDLTAVTSGTGISISNAGGPVPTITNSMATEITAAGDIVVGTGSGTFDNLPIGTTGQVLTADTTVSPYKVKWAAAAGGGKVLQVVSTHKSNTFTTTSTSYTDITDFSVTITPSATSSKILIFVSCKISQTSYPENARLTLLRGSTEIANTGTNGFDWVCRYNDSNTTPQMVYTHPSNIHFLDSPSTTSSTTYKVQMKVSGATGTFNRSGHDTAAVGTSTITVMEIGA